MSEANGHRPIRVDVNDLTLGEMANAEDACGESLATPGSNFRRTAAMAWQVMLRTDTTATYEQALGLRMGDLEIVGAPEDAEGEVPAADTGGTPVSSPVSGASIPSA